MHVRAGSQPHALLPVKDLGTDKVSAGSLSMHVAGVTFGDIGLFFRDVVSSFIKTGKGTT